MAYNAFVELLRFVESVCVEDCLMQLLSDAFNDNDKDGTDRQQQLSGTVFPIVR